MIEKTAQKLQAIELRKKGFSYSEILDKVHVSPASLSLWLHKIELSQKQKLRLIEKSIVSRKKGSGILKKYRILKSQKIFKEATSEIKKISKRDLALIGTTLYWAEGNKQKEHNPSVEAIFSNSDPKMIQIYLAWLKRCLKIDNTKLVFEIYIHETYKKSEKELRSYWSKTTGFPVDVFRKIYFKKNKVHSYRKNRGDGYFGVLRIRIRKSTDLNRKITGWIDGIYLNSRVAS